MKIAISGSNGFIGKHLVNLLRHREDIELILIDRKNNFDLSDKRSIESIELFDVFIHLAGVSYVPDSFQNPESFYNTNFITTLNALELCRRNKAKMIFISSYVYGNPEYLPIDEKHPVKPFNPYAQTKIIGEQLCQGYFRDFGVPCIILRPFNIFGEGQNQLFLIPSIISSIKQGLNPIKLQDPAPRRDFIHVTDVAKIIELCAYNNTLSFEIFNVASGTSYSVSEISEMFKEIVGKEKILEFQFDLSVIRKNEVHETRGSYDKINNLLNWVPSISLYDGIRGLLNEKV